jgi:hemin uptake protein HemP
LVSKANKEGKQQKQLDVKKLQPQQEANHKRIACLNIKTGTSKRHMKPKKKVKRIRI